MGVRRRRGPRGRRFVPLPFSPRGGPYMRLTLAVILLASSAGTPARASEVSSAADKTTAATTAPSTTAGASWLDGTRWIIKVTPDQEAREKGEKAFDDVIVFDGGKVSMTACVKVGFAASDYRTGRASTGKMGFLAKQRSETEGDSEWSGMMEGGSI